MADYLIKDIPVEKMKEFKTACAYFKVTMRDAIINQMEPMIIHHKTLTGQLKGKQKPSKKKGK